MEIILAVLAVYRLARMIGREEGSFNIFLRWRGFLAAKLGATSWIAEGFGCPLCLSFWIALLAVLPLHPSDLLTAIVLWFGIAGGAAFVYKMERAE